MFFLVIFSIPPISTPVSNSEIKLKLYKIYKLLKNKILGYKIGCLLRINVNDRND
jgi:hypothetical protein